jgi:transcriptional regulator with XRE-family HTH domain
MADQLNEQEQHFTDLAERIRALREACGTTDVQLAKELDVSIDTYRQWESDGADIPISALYHIAHKFGIDLTELLTGVSAKLNTYQVVRRGEGKVIDRYPDYHFEDMAWRYRDKIMQPLMVILDPNEKPTELITHAGQEFNFVIEGSIVVVFGDKEIVLNKYDSIYFNPAVPHGQKCYGDAPAKFITVIAE